MKKSVKQLFAHKAVIAVLFFILGGLVISGVYSYRLQRATSRYGFSPTHNAEHFFDELFNDDFFARSHNPFGEMQRIESSIVNQFVEPGVFEGSFAKWYRSRFGGGELGEITQREDTKNIYYDINLKTEAPANVKVDVRGNQVYVSAESEIRNDENGNTTYQNSRFERSFPAPSNVETQNYHLDRAGSKITLKFPKKTSI